MTKCEMCGFELQRLRCNNCGKPVGHLYLTEQQECEHEYPGVWMGIIPPHCKKCGKSAEVTTISSKTTEILQNLA